MYTITTKLPTMNDDDLKWNYKKYRRKYWIRESLWIPEDIPVVFGKLSRMKLTKEFAGYIAQSNDKIIRLDPILKHVWPQAMSCLLHEMGHLYVGVSTNWDLRKCQHGKTFQKEMDRLYNLRAFRDLI